MQLTKRQKAILVILALPVLFGLGLLILRSEKKPPPVVREERAVQKKEKNEAIFVDIGGAVRDPGVYEFASGERVVDALRRAGGALKDADLDQVNLASKLEDGQKVLIPRKITQPRGAPPASSQSQSQTMPGSKMNINSATVEQLDSIDGIGPVLAKRIINYRETNGSFKSLDQLREVEGIGEKKFERLRDRVSL